MRSPISRADAPPRARGRQARGFAACLLATGLAGCVTTILEPQHDPTPLAQGAVVIPLAPGGEGSGPIDEFYRDIVMQMREAAAERNRERLADLLELHDRADLPQWVQPQIARHRLTLLAIDFERHVTRQGAFALADEPVPLGAPLDVTFRVPPRGGDGTRVGIGGAGFALHVRFELRDTDVFGSVTRRSGSDVLRLRDPFDLAVQELSLPIRIVAPADAAVVRQLDLVAELLPGEAELSGTRVPYQRVLCQSFTRILYPDGVAPIRNEPMKTLRAALALGDAAHWPHLYLACTFLGPDERDDATALLMRLVQLAEPGTRRVAIAGLRVLHPDGPGLDDREGWLRWWSRQSGGR